MQRHGLGVPGRTTTGTQPRLLTASNFRDMTPVEALARRETPGLFGGCVMHELERNWWEELADQYEAWAENPPQTPYCHVYRYERHTCEALQGSAFGWSSPRYGYPTSPMSQLWVWQYGDTGFPAGETYAEDRDDKRFEFCHYIAETIRDYLETGRGPWEDA